jgi:hypothetical protein
MLPITVLLETARLSLAPTRESCEAIGCCRAAERAFRWSRYVAVVACWMAVATALSNALTDNAISWIVPLAAAATSITIFAITDAAIRIIIPPFHS